MKKIFVFLLLLLQLIIASVAGAAPNIPAKPTGANFYVLDQANVISAADEQRIYNFAKTIENRTTAQIAVLTVKSLEGYPIDEYALAVLRKWGVGQRDQNNGVLILVAPNERRSRIEVGYGLEGVLTDGRTGRIQDTYMLPFFRKGNYSTGIMVGTAAVASSIDHGGPIGAVVQEDGKAPERLPGDYSKFEALNKEMGISSSSTAALASYDQVLAQADKLLKNSATSQVQAGTKANLNQSANGAQRDQSTDAQANAQNGGQSQGLSLLEMLIIAGVLIIDWVFLGGFITRTIFYMLLFRGGGGGRRGGGGFGGGSGGGGGSSRSW